MKMKKMLSSFLAAAMVMSTMSIAVFADAIDTAEEFTDAVANGGTIVLEGDIDVAETVVVPEDVTVDIDLGGYTVTGTMHKSLGAVIENNGTLTLKNGTVSSTADNGGSAVLNNGTATVEKATLNGAPNAGDSWPSYTVNNSGVMTIQDSTITSYHGAVASYGDGAVVTLKNTNIDMSGIPGFTSHALYTYDKGAVIVDGGKIENKAKDQNSTGGSVINGAVTVIDGEFSGRIENYFGHKEPVIYGGTFDVKVPAKYLPEGAETETDANGNVVVKTAAAKVGTVNFSTLKEATDAAADGDEVVILMPGTYKLPGFAKDITITAKDGVEVIFDNIGAHNMQYSNVTFNNVIFDYYPNVNYTGLQHSGNLTYNNCTVNGQVFLYGESDVFNKCTFNQNSSGAYNVWTYGSRNAVFTDCTFNSAGKSVLIYIEKADAAYDNTFNGCEFYASEAVEGKAAIEIDSTNGYGKDTFHNVKADNCTADGFAAGSVSGDTLWNEKKGSNTDVVIDNVVVAAEDVVLDRAEYADYSNRDRESLLLTFSKVGQINDSMIIEVYHDDELLSTTNLRKTDRDDENTVLIPKEYSGITANILYGGTDLSGSWDTVLESAMTADREPNKVVVTIDGVEKYNKALTNIAGNKYTDFDYLTSGEFNSGIVGVGVDSKNRERFFAELQNVKAYDSLVMKTYSDDVLIATTTLRDYDRDDENAALYPHIGGGTVNVVLPNYTAGSWDTQWHYAPDEDLVPNKVELWVDGVLKDTKEGITDADAEAYKNLVSVAKFANEIKLSYEKVNDKEYKIYVESVDGKNINRLSAVEGKFDFIDLKGKATYELTAADGVTLVSDRDDENVYEFNFNPDATGTKLEIGKVTFTATEAEFGFGLVAYDETTANTATLLNNIVYSYVPDGDMKVDGKFNVTDSVIDGGVKIKEETTEVKVVIDFNNKITAGNEADYNDMKVTLTGSNGDVYEGYVGSAPATDVADDNVFYFENTAEKVEMTFNVKSGYRYTAVVKGEGYRTARYTTVVDDATTLKFWNNAMADENNNPVLVPIEEYFESSKRDITFLAGDIALDNVIDKYDLAAVVSYFGYDENTEKVDMADYVKYDLNRDGRIDADDISYVLVSWGK